jgi:hypothetical protein
MAEDDIEEKETEHKIGFTKLSNEFIQNLPYTDSKSVKVYVYLMSCTNKKKWGDLRCFPSWSTIKKNTGIKSNKTLGDAITGLCEDGWIINIISRNDKSNVYFMSYTQEVNEELVMKRDVRKLNRGIKMIQSKKEAKEKKERLENGIP